MKFDIVIFAQCGVDTALGGAGVASKRMELRQHGDRFAGALQFARSRETRKARTDDDNIVFMYLYTHV